MNFLTIDHVLLAIPADGEEAARAFYGDALGLTEIPKPATLAARGGVWFAAGAVQLHLGIEEPFRPAKKAHPAIRVEGLQELARRLIAEGYEPLFDEDLPGFNRFYLSDPFGNRLEFLEPR